MAEEPTVADLQSIGESVAALSRKLRKTAGLTEGHVERLATTIERILRDYGGVNRYRQYRSLVRDLDEVAGEVARLKKAEALHPKFVKILDAALLKIRKRDLYSGGQLVGKLAKARALARDRDRLLAEYREGYRGLEREVARLRAERDRLRSVRKPPMSEADVERIRGVLDVANRALANAVTTELHGVPSRLALPAFLETSRDRRLLLPRPDDPDDVKGLLDLLRSPGPVRTVFGDRGVHSLLEALSTSDARLAHLLGDGRPLKNALRANLTWLKALTAAGTLLPPLSWETPFDDLRSRTEAVVQFAGMLHDAQEAQGRLEEFARLVSSGEAGKGQESERIYRQSREAARSAWDGTLESSVRSVEAELAARLKDLESLSPPDRL